MAKTRLQIPKTIRDAVLKEFNHRCAICGADRPQIDHIDENPSNNDSLNLILLCPNHHLSDKHNPTQPIDSGILSLLRRYKDPTIMKPQFYPLFSRMRFLSSINNEPDGGNLYKQAKELADFVACLEMGVFYSKRIAELLQYPGGQVSDWRDPDAMKAYDARRAKEYSERVCAEKDEVTRLCIELLRFQKW